MGQGVYHQWCRRGAPCVPGSDCPRWRRSGAQSRGRPSPRSSSGCPEAEPLCCMTCTGAGDENTGSSADQSISGIFRAPGLRECRIKPHGGCDLKIPGPQRNNFPLSQILSFPRPSNPAISLWFASPVRRHVLRPRAREPVRVLRADGRGPAASRAARRLKRHLHTVPAVPSRYHARWTAIISSGSTHTCVQAPSAICAAATELVP